MEAGAVAILAKPFSDAALIEAVKTALSTRVSRANDPKEIDIARWRR